MARGIRETEVFVAGGGPAGLAAAIASAQAGFAVTLADCARPPIDKACGEGIMPAGIAALQQLGVNFSPSQAAHLHGIRFVDAHGSVEARFQTGAGCGVRRTVLHQQLMERAADAGVEMRWGVRVDGRSTDAVFVDGQIVRSRWLVCADGQNSSLRELAGLAHLRATRRRFGFCHHYGMPPWSDQVEVHWSDGAQLYVTPVAADQVCVALLTRDSGLRLDDALPRFPEVAERLKRRRPLCRRRGAVTATRTLPRVQRDNFALLGDSSGSVDAITGEGLTMAFQQALALGAAMKADDLGLYERAHRRIFRLPRLMAELTLTMDKHSGLRRRLFRAFSAEPGLFARLVAIHTGASSPFSFGIGGTVSLGWHLLTA